jgi:hypothetical protein
MTRKFFISPKKPSTSGTGGSSNPKAFNPSVYLPDVVFSNLIEGFLLAVGNSFDRWRR